jgi:hypothetical protein
MTVSVTPGTPLTDTESEVSEQICYDIYAAADEAAVAEADQAAGVMSGIW